MPILSKSDIEKLRKGTTAEPWRVGYPNRYCTIKHPEGSHGNGKCDYAVQGWIDNKHKITNEENVEICGSFDCEDDGVINECDSAFIAALPSITETCLAALSRVEELEQFILENTSGGEGVKRILGITDHKDM